MMATSVVHVRNYSACIYTESTLHMIPSSNFVTSTFKILTRDVKSTSANDLCLL
jgi:hypothetical protein